MFQQNKYLLLIVCCTFNFSLLNAQRTPCAIKDTNGTVQQQTTQQQFLLAHTDSALWAYLPNTDQLVIEMSLSYLQKGYYVLNIVAKVTTINAPTYYGIVQANAPLTFTFLDGSNCVLSNLTQSLPQLITDQPIYEYKMTYLLSGKAVKQLKLKQLHQVRINWSNRSERYEIYDVAILKRHFACLSQRL